MKPIAILEHSAEVPPGYLADAIDRAGLPSTVIRLYAGDALPDLGEIAAVVSLGGIMGAYEEDEHPFLGAEKSFLRAAVDRDVPVLGICLGCQLLADALGGGAGKAEELEVEFVGLDLSSAGESDPVVRSLASPVVSFHQDTWEPPPGAAVLASSGKYRHAFRLGSALAIQSHPEASAEMVDGWVEGFGRHRLEEAGVDPDALLARVRAGAAANESRALALFSAWLDEVESRIK